MSCAAYNSNLNGSSMMSVSIGICRERYDNYLKPTAVAVFYAQALVLSTYMQPTKKYTVWNLERSFL